MSSVNLQAPFGVPLLTESLICPQNAIPHKHPSVRDLHVHQSAFAPEIPDTNGVDMKELYNGIASNDERIRLLADRVIDERTIRIHGFPDAEIAVFDHMSRRRHRAIAPRDLPSWLGHDCRE